MTGYTLVSELTWDQASEVTLGVLEELMDLSEVYNTIGKKDRKALERVIQMFLVMSELDD